MQLLRFILPPTSTHLNGSQALDSPTLLPETTPSRGSSTTGRNEVTPMGTHSKSHHAIINSAVPAV